MSPVRHEPRRYTFLEISAQLIAIKFPGGLQDHLRNGNHYASSGERQKWRNREGVATHKFLRAGSYREREHSAADRIPNSAMSAILMQFRQVVVSARENRAESRVFRICLRRTIPVSAVDEYFSRITSRRWRKTRSPSAIVEFQRVRAKRVLQSRLRETRGEFPVLAFAIDIYLYAGRFLFLLKPLSFVV